MSKSRVFSPLHKAMRQVGLHLEEVLSDLDLPAGDSHLVTYLGRFAPSRPGELSRVFGLKRSTLTGVLDRLEERGLLVREPDPYDRRSFLVQLTDAGHDLAREVEARSLAVERRVRTRVSAQDLAGFQAVLEAIQTTTGVVVRRQRGDGTGSTAVT